MAKRRSYHSKRTSSATVIGILLTVIALLALSVFIYYSYIASQRPELDQTTLCPENGPTGHLAILIDTTDPLSITQLQAARQKIEEKVSDASIGTRISFSTISPEIDIRNQSFYSICKPPTGESASKFTQNEKLIEEKYQNSFLLPIRQTLDRLLVLNSANSSPILEGVQEFLTKIPNFITTNEDREFVIMSDLIQHNASFSFYKGFSWDKFRSHNGLSRLSRNLGGVNVTVLRIPRNISNAENVDDFWVRYFEAQGVTRITVHTIGDI